jgi:hypothetical protein
MALTNRRVLSLKCILSSLLLSTALSPAMPVLGVSIAQASNHTSLKSLVLTLRDLANRRGWHQTDAIQPNEAVAAAERVSMRTINRYRITGYGTSLFRQSRGSGIVSIGDSVGLYKTVVAAKWQYEKFTSVNKQPPRTRKITMSGIGDQARGFGASTSSFGIASIYFRRGIFATRLDVASLGPIKSSDVLRLARILDHRMKSAH